MCKLNWSIGLALISVNCIHSIPLNCGACLYNLTPVCGGLPGGTKKESFANKCSLDYFNCITGSSKCRRKIKRKKWFINSKKYFDFDRLCGFVARTLFQVNIQLGFLSIETFEKCHRRASIVIIDQCQFLKFVLYRLSPICIDIADIDWVEKQIH